MERDAVVGWVAAYEQAWRDADPDAVETLFSPDATYRVSPYAEPLVGHHAIKDFWLDDEGTSFTVDHAVITVDADRAVVRLEVQYGEPTNQQYRDLWLLRFADDGRVAEFEEWAYWPDKSHAAPADDA